jgi:hypothetical protein
MNICISCPEGHPVMLASEKLGQMAACPRCFATFRAELDVGPTVRARKDDRKVRRSRDDDDDEEEEEERPKKKLPPKKEVKKPIKRRARDDDDDDDEDDDEGDEEDEGEQEDEIEWTGRKRQLNKCGIGLMVMMVAFYMLVAMIVFLILPMIWTIFDVGNDISDKSKLVEPKTDDWIVLGAWIIGPMAALAQTTLIIGLFMNFFVPARVEGRSMVLCALIFGGLVYLLGALIVSAGFITSDAERANNMRKLLIGGAGLCFVVSIFSAMAYLAKLMTFMKLHLEASQPITNAGFFFMYFAAMFAIYVANAYVCYYLYWFACFAMILALFAAAGMAVRAGVAQALLFQRMRGVIMQYIRDS